MERISRKAVRFDTIDSGKSFDTAAQTVRKRVLEHDISLLQLYCGEEFDRAEAPRTANRGAMGNYLFDARKGEKPLTQLDYPSPGPADYSPQFNIIKRRNPEYSIRPWTRLDYKNQCGKAEEGPGPAHNTAQDAIFKCPRQVTVKGRHFSTDAEPIGPGPAYKVTTGDCGTKKASLKTTIKKRFTNKSFAGLNPPRMAPVDSAAYMNIGHVAPKIDNRSKPFSHNPKWYISSPRGDQEIPPGPGPGAYLPHAEIKNPQPGKTLSKRFPAKKVMSYGPGPATHVPKYRYQLPKYPSAIVIPNRMPSNEYRVGPAPNEYFIKGKYDGMKKMYDMKAPNITYRYHTERNDTEGQPGPCDYNIRGDTSITGGVMSSRAKPVKLSNKSGNSPGSAAYNPQSHCVGKNACGFSFGRKLDTRTVKPGTAGAGDYMTRDVTYRGSNSAPSYSLHGTRTTSLKMSRDPGPNQYKIELGKAGPAYTIGGRYDEKPDFNRTGTKDDKPAPNSYNVRRCTFQGRCKTGALSLGCRHTPHQYPGPPVKENRVIDIARDGLSTHITFG